MCYALFVLVVCLVTKTFARIEYDSVGTSAEFQCFQNCPLQNRTDIGHYDYACNFDCNIAQCSKGCKLWKNALLSSCQKVCNGTTERLSHRELYCVMGCNDAIAEYFTRVRLLLGVPTAPALLDNSLEATSLKLEWKFPEATRAGLSCHVQWRYEEIAATWQYCRNATWSPETSDFLVEGLQPYTKYRFRVALNLGHGHGDPIYSAQSVVIATLAAGVPASPPTHVRAAPVDAHSVSVSWEPGPFPHGPLLSYVLQITDNHPPEGREARSEVKDVPSTSSFYVFRNQKPQSNFTVSVKMRNSYGPGPAATVQVSTPKEAQILENQQPILILGTEYAVFELEYLLGEPIHLFHSDQTRLQGIAIHISKKLLFISDANGSVWRIPIEQETKNKSQILAPEQIDFMPLELAVDWLNDQLYILGEVVPRKNQGRYVIKRCNLDGSGLTVALAGLTKKPNTMQIDPCNGYLFWSIRDYNTGGLYRLETSDISNGIKHEIKVERILRDTNLGAFVVDHANFRLLVSNQRLNTILAVSLDGKDVTNLRPKVTNAKLYNVISLATANQKFYWTDGGNVYNEEYHPGYGSYFHNKISHLGTSQYKKILINLPSSQPWPIPLNPPTNLQAVFGNKIAKSKWNPPHLLGLQGKGAWQNWSYEISVKDLSSHKIMSFNTTNTTSFSINNLTADSEYMLRVSAYSRFGKGPWSSEFRGTTIKADRNPQIIWSGSEGVVKSDTAIENVETLIHKTGMQNIGFTGMSWYQDQIYMVANNSHVYWYNLTTHKQGRLADLDSVGSIAVDWIGRKLYWSDLKQQWIMRGNLNGTQQERMSILTLAKELSIDSVKAYLYWSREYVVECAHLNGMDKMEYHHIAPFSGKQVMGLTLDMDKKFVYWIVRGSEKSHLFQAPMAGYGNSKRMEKTEVALLQASHMEGSPSYFSNRLLWLQDEKNAVISDLSGKNMATVSGKSIWGLNLVYVVDDSSHSWPENITKKDVNITPEMVDKYSIIVIGSAEAFNITWSPVKNVNYGVVFYEVQIDKLPSSNSTKISTKITTEPTIKYWREVTPFTRLYVAIRAVTYWASSPQITTEVFSPPSTPSVPRNLRTYVVYEHNSSLDGENVTVTFRWDPPLFPNGVLQGYKIRCWYMENEVEMELCDDVKEPANQTEYVISELTRDEIYFFQVQAFTEIGTGTMSLPISVNSSLEAPLPTLLIASEDAIFIDDIDTNQNFSLVNSINPPLEISYLIQENKVFWINEMQELITYHLDSTNKTKIFDLKGYPKGLTIDWLERSLYYVEKNNGDFGSVVRKIDLNLVDRNVVRSSVIFLTHADITKIEISPFTKKLYWVETVDGFNHKIMKSNVDGTEITEFFFDSIRKKTDIFDGYFEEDKCDCPFGTNVEPTFTIDHSGIDIKPSIIFIDSDNKNVFASDTDGCSCNVIANNTIISQTLPLKRIKSDFGSLYWTSLDGTLHALNRKDAKILSKEIKATDVLIYGKHMQPYPSKECLTPKQYGNFTPSIKRRSAHSLTLTMPKVMFSPTCLNTSTATAMYTIRYRELLHSKEDMQRVATFDKIYELLNLKPFTNYNITVAVSNHFTDKDDIVYGPPIVFRTAPGAPSKPQNISASVLHPTLAQVNWLPPKQLNGDVVHYEIHWLTEGSLTGVRQKGEQPVVELNGLDNTTKSLTTLLQKLSPNETYTVWIRAYSETNETSSDSDRVQITTYPEPAAFDLVNRTSQSLSLSWEVTSHIQKYVVEFAPITSANSWIETGIGEHYKDLIEITVKELKPKTQYKFRLSLLYDKYPEWYIWPSDSRFTFETLGDKPSAPGVPGIQFFGPNVYKVVWEASQDNGAIIELYLLESLKIRSFRNKRSTANNRSAWFYSAPSIEEEEYDWEQVYNGTENSWVITDLSDKYKYAFRVSALNSYGWSEPSAESTEFDISEAERISQKNPMNLIFIATFVPLSIFVAIVICFIYLTYSRKCGKQKKIEHVVAIQRGPDVELATLRELPRRGVHSTNILYVSAAPNSEEITMLPHIRRDQITLTKFLGSGAFGEVFEGKAKGLESGAADTKVAVKTLKKGASDQEKSEFLQEAQLMSHFKHEHILQLLGVCLDNDPQFIIMELMQGGDLLTYLRDSRSQLNNTPTLNLIELLKMCLDVSKGCKYLEEMHFVHRDLACRNCLVSAVESENRIVKIGDFGLARDIYKNDYYRKEGEGLLPVRWMAPESLLDGVFTSQSDAWAFGVLLWEIMTLGQQPYQARSNLEVLHYVKGGGRLGKPTDCPEDLYKLMLECWEFVPEKRPTFKYCLEVLDHEHRHHLRNPTTAAHSHYISTVPDLFAGISNAAYFLDENENSSGMSWKSDTDDDPNKEKTPFLRPELDTVPKEIPKYLDLLYEPDQDTTPLENDGYEIPNDMMDKQGLSNNGTLLPKDNLLERQPETVDNAPISDNEGETAYTNT